MPKEDKNIKHIDTVRFIPCEIHKTLLETPYNTYVSIDIYRTKNHITLTLYDLIEKGNILTLSLDAELCGMLLSKMRKASRSE